jgi:hypothetical protein
MLIDPIPKNRNEKERHQENKLQTECGYRINGKFWLDPQFMDQVCLREGYHKQPKEEEWVGICENAFTLDGIAFVGIVLQHGYYLQP